MPLLCPLLVFKQFSLSLSLSIPFILSIAYIPLIVKFPKGKHKRNAYAQNLLIFDLILVLFLFDYYIASKSNSPSLMFIDVNVNQQFVGTWRNEKRITRERCDVIVLWMRLVKQENIYKNRDRATTPTTTVWFTNRTTVRYWWLKKPIKSIRFVIKFSEAKSLLRLLLFSASCSYTHIFTMKVSLILLLCYSWYYCCCCFCCFCYGCGCGCGCCLLCYEQCVRHIANLWGRNAI